MKTATRVKAACIVWTVIIATPVVFCSLLVVILFLASRVLPKRLAHSIAAVAEPLIVVTNKLFRYREYKIRHAGYEFLHKRRKLK